MFGKLTNAEGKPLVQAKVLTGLNVQNNKLLSFGLSKDVNGNVVNNRATIEFEQPNGFVFRYNFLAPSENAPAWAIDRLNAQMAQICLAMVTVGEYTEVVSGFNGDFAKFINLLSEKITSKHIGKAFDLKIVYKQNTQSGKYYAQLPQVGDFIAPAGMGANLFKANEKYDLFTIPVEENMDDMEAQATTATASDDMPF